MKRSQLRQLVLEAMKGYTKNPQTGEIETTQGGTTDDFRNILTKIAKGHPEEDKQSIYEGQDEQTYIVYYRVGEDDDDDVEVKASSAAEAIEKAKSGKTAGGQNMPKLARSFSAKLK